MAPAATTLFGWPAEARCDAPATGALCVLGAPSDRGNAIARGAAGGPTTIRRASLAPDASGRTVACDDARDCGDLEVPAAADATTVLAALEAAIAGIVGHGGCPLLLGGDHSLTFAPVSVLSRTQDLCLVWFDAHTDFSPWPGRGAHDHKQVLRRISELPGVRRVVQIGYRGLTIGDERHLGNDAVVVTTAHARRLDADGLLALLPAHLPCYLSIDIDAIDPLWAPGTAAPVADGLLPDTVAAMLRTIVRHRRVIGVDVVEVNPALDVHDRTSRIAAELAGEIATHWHHQRALGTGGTAAAPATHLHRVPAHPVDRAIQFPAP